MIARRLAYSLSAPTPGLTTHQALLMFNQMVEHSSTALDSTYAALAHPTRRDLLDILRAGPIRVTDIANPFSISLAAVSKHVGVLEGAGLVTRKVSGREHILALEARPLLDARGWIDTYQGFWEGRLDALESQLKEER